MVDASVAKQLVEASRVWLETVHHRSVSPFLRIRGNPPHGMHLVAVGCWLLLNPSGVIGEPAATSGVRAQGGEEVHAGKGLP